MISLRTVHLVFLLIVIVGADLFGAWGVWSYTRTGEGLDLAMGIVSLVGGLGLVAYAYMLIRKLDAARIR
jgi:hypothetical protein